MKFLEISTLSLARKKNSISINRMYAQGAPSQRIMIDLF